MGGKERGGKARVGRKERRMLKIKTTETGETAQPVKVLAAQAWRPGFSPQSPQWKEKARPERCPLRSTGSVVPSHLPVVVHRHSPVVVHRHSSVVVYRHSPVMMMITNENTATKLLKIVTMDPESINTTSLHKGKEQFDSIKI